MDTKSITLPCLLACVGNNDEADDCAGKSIHLIVSSKWGCPAFYMHEFGG